jgi:uncharacterized protein DUF1801
MAVKEKPGKTESAADFMAKLDHPLKAEIEAVRKIILGADTSIEEGIKWNSVSFRTGEWFATFHLRATDSVQVVMHLGAKAKGKKVEVDDPGELLQWLGKERAIVKLADMKEIKAKKAALQAVVRQWIEYV